MGGWRVLLAIVLLPIVYGAPPSTSDCGSLFGFFTIHNQVALLLPKVAAKVRNYLHLVPEVLLGNRPPDISAIRNLDFKHLDKWSEPSGKVDGNEGRLLDDQAYRDLIKLFTVVEGGADYYFAGNHMLPFFVMARALFEGTALGGRIHFVPVSRNLLYESRSNPAPLSQFLRRTGIGVGTSKIVIIDSVASHGVKDAHSLSILSRRVREIVTEDRGLTPALALETVVPVGLPENNARSHSRVADWQEYRARIAQYGQPKFEPPYLHPRLSFQLVSDANSAPRWTGKSSRDLTGKFDRLDIDGNPDTVNPFAQLSGKAGEIDEYRRIINGRVNFLRLVRKLDEKGRALRNTSEFKEVILRTVEANSRKEKAARPAGEG